MSTVQFWDAMTAYPQKVTFGEMRASGVCTVLIYRASIATATDSWGRTPRPIGKPPSKLHRTSTAVGLCAVDAYGRPRRTVDGCKWLVPHRVEFAQSFCGGTYVQPHTLDQSDG